MGNGPGAYISKENALGLDFVDFSGDSKFRRKMF